MNENQTNHQEYIDQMRESIELIHRLVWMIQDQPEFALAFITNVAVLS